LGRDERGWAVAWDGHISRRHAHVRWQNGRLSVECLPEARNPIFVRGRELTQFTIEPGDYFVIGETTFTLTSDGATIAPDPQASVNEKTFAVHELDQIRYRNADQRIEVLARLPEVIARAATEDELFVQLVNMLLVGLPRADAVAMVTVVGDGDDARVEVLHWDRRRAELGAFQPSERLVRKAVHSRQSVVHTWESSATSGDQPYTLADNTNWALCTPEKSDATRRWALYATGQSASSWSGTPGEPNDLREEVKFTELIAAVMRSLLELRKLQKRYTGLSQFFAPSVLSAIAGEGADAALAPKETDVTVLFCDLRGFSRESERFTGDLLGLLERVSRALGVMTFHILEQGGVVGDFQGDSAMGFWGWPLAHKDIVARACRAALAIRREFQEAACRPGDPLADFQVGIGVATGRAVAGRIGTVDQVKVTVFGPVVNRASRLEGMTKIFRAAILHDEATARVVRETMDAAGEARCRRVAVVKPYGMDTPVEVSELLPPEVDAPEIRTEDLADYETALNAFLDRRWADAFDQLHRVPPGDRVKDFLTVYIAQRNRMPPPDWNGVIELTSKS
jgi:adenylate cyclase